MFQVRDAIQGHLAGDLPTAVRHKLSMSAFQRHNTEMTNVIDLDQQESSSDVWAWQTNILKDKDLDQQESSSNVWTIQTNLVKYTQRDNDIAQM